VPVSGLERIVAEGPGSIDCKGVAGNIIGRGILRQKAAGTGSGREVCDGATIGNGSRDITGVSIHLQGMVKFGG
jgi:hypothetical protein